MTSRGGPQLFTLFHFLNLVSLAAPRLSVATFQCRLTEYRSPGDGREYPTTVAWVQYGEILANVELLPDDMEERFSDDGNKVYNTQDADFV